jgi:energy-converting hydrogenase Eha subunit B
MEREPLLCQSAAMSRRSTQSGGFLLMSAILIGAYAGFAKGDPMKYILAGTGAGIVAAVAVWLLDRRR